LRRRSRARSRILLPPDGLREPAATFAFLRSSRVGKQLDLLVLKSLGTGPNHGYGIAMRIHQLSDDVLRIEEGSLYPALYRMEEQALIESEWRVTDNNRKAKFYRLTRKGRAAADAELDSWLRLSRAVTRVLRGLEQGA
jgi:PadR family transcriptional regulator, regulatory protein PadR